MSSSVRFLATAAGLVALVTLASCAGSTRDGGTVRMRSSDGFATRSFEARSIELTGDDRDVKSISPGGYIRIVEGSPWLGRDRFYEIRADSSGSLSRTYRVAGRDQTMDAGAQAWAAAAILTMVRETGISADLRVERLLRQGGPSAVLREVSEIRSDGSKRIYLRELIERGRLDNRQLEDALRSARAIGSDGDKTELLVGVSRSFLNSDLREAWFTALSGVGSDGDKRRALEHAIRNDPGSETLALAAKLASGMGSDGDKAAVLSAIMQRRLDPLIRRAWFRAVSTIGSDGDKRQVLSAALAVRDAGDADSLLEVLRAAGTIGSDGDKAHLLLEAARSDLRADAVRRAFFAAANSIGSDGDRRAVLTSVLHMANPPLSLLTDWLESAQGLGSDGDKAALLSLVAELEMNDAASRASFFAAVNSVSQDGERAAILSRILGKPKLAPETAVAAIDSAGGMGSDGDKASVLLLAVPHASHPAARTALENALKSVHSDGDYRRVSSALLRQ